MRGSSEGMWLAQCLTHSQCLEDNVVSGKRRAASSKESVITENSRRGRAINISWAFTMCQVLDIQYLICFL